MRSAKPAEMKVASKWPEPLVLLKQKHDRPVCGQLGKGDGAGGTRWWLEGCHA